MQSYVPVAFSEQRNAFDLRRTWLIKDYVINTTIPVSWNTYQIQTMWASPSIYSWITTFGDEAQKLLFLQAPSWLMHAKAWTPLICILVALTLWGFEVLVVLRGDAHRKTGCQYHCDNCSLLPSKKPHGWLASIHSRHYPTWTQPAYIRMNWQSGPHRIKGVKFLGGHLEKMRPAFCPCLLSWILLKQRLFLSVKQNMDAICFLSDVL